MYSMMISIAILIGVISLMLFFIGGAFCAQLDKVPFDKKLSKVSDYIRETGLDVTVTDKHYSFGFSFHLFGRRRIYLSKHVFSLLTQREVIALILHESGHIVLHHNMRDLIRRFLFESAYVALFIIFGRMDLMGVGFYAVIRLIGYIIDTLIYRSQEKAADKYVCEMGYGKYYISTLNKLKIYIKTSRTHPPIEDRITMIRKWNN